MQEPSERWELPELVGGREVDRKSSLPRLSPASGRVEQPGVRTQPIQVIPAGLEKPDRFSRLVSERYPILVVELAAKELTDLNFD